MLPLSIPGGTEVLVFLLLFSLPVLFVVFIVLLVRDVFGGGSTDSSALESRVDALEERVEEIEADDE
jgi:hypothetical protein